jgi:enamine deaminase RidA (YjgF/YER057c/UK114 family)
MATLRLTQYVNSSPKTYNQLLIETSQRQIISNLGAILDEAGSSLNDVIEVNIYLSDMKYYAKMNEVYAEYWGDIKPART